MAGLLKRSHPQEGAAGFAGGINFNYMAHFSKAGNLDQINQSNVLDCSTETAAGYLNMVHITSVLISSLVDEICAALAENDTDGARIRKRDFPQSHRCLGKRFTNDPNPFQTPLRSHRERCGGSPGAIFPISL